MIEALEHTIWRSMEEDHLAVQPEVALSMDNLHRKELCDMNHYVVADTIHDRYEEIQVPNGSGGWCRCVQAKAGPLWLVSADSSGNVRVHFLDTGDSWQEGIDWYLGIFESEKEAVAFQNSYEG